MKNFVQSGNTITLTAPADVLAGGIVKVGSFIGVAATDAASGGEVETALAGVFDLPKAAVAISQGDSLYWDSANGQVVKTASGNTAIGTATAAAASGVATVPVRLLG